MLRPSNFLLNFSAVLPVAGHARATFKGGGFWCSPRGGGRAAGEDGTQKHGYLNRGGMQGASGSALVCGMWYATEVKRAVEWLKLLQPGEPIPYHDAISAAHKAQAIDAEDVANMRPVGRPAEIVYNQENDVNNSARPTGNTAAAAIRRLRKDKPDMG